MKTSIQPSASHKPGFASILYVLVLGIALIGVLVANLYPNQVKNRVIAAELTKQNMNAIMEADAYNIARGTVQHIAIGMEDPSAATGLGSTFLYKPYTITENSLITQTSTTSASHDARVRAVADEGQPIAEAKSTKASLPTSNPTTENINGNALAYGTQNGANLNFNLSQDSSVSWLRNIGWGSPNYEVNSNPFNTSAAGIGIPTLHANYTYGMGHPAEYFLNESTPNTFTIRNNGDGFQSPVRPLNLNPFSGWGFYVNPRATNGFALYPPELFPGLALNGKPMLGRLHIYKYDREFTLGTNSTNSNFNKSNIPARYRVRVMLMEVPFQNALDYEGELQVNASTFWNSAVIQGVINTEKITGAGIIKTGGSVNAGIQTQTGISGTVSMNSEILDDNSLIKRSVNSRDASKQDLQIRKNTNRIGDARTMVRAFLVNPARLGNQANKRNWFEWPTGGTRNQSANATQWQTNFADTNTGGGPTIDQYNCGVTQTDLQLRIEENGPHTVVRVWKMRANGMAFVAKISSNTTDNGIEPGYTAPGAGGETFSTAIAVVGGGSRQITLNLQAISKIFKANMAGTRQITNREWPIRGISIYKDPERGLTTDPAVLVQDAADLNDYHEGLALVSQFPTQITENFNDTVVDPAAKGPAWRYRNDTTINDLCGINTTKLRPPAAIYAPRLSFFTGTGNAIGKLTINGSIQQRGTAPFLPPTSTGVNPVTNDYKNKKIIGSGLKLEVFAGNFNGLEELNLTGIRHQVELPPIVPTKWLVTYIVENFH